MAEDSIYVGPEAQGHGVGRALLAAVVASAERAGIWMAQTGIFPENQASVLTVVDTSWHRTDRPLSM